MSVVACGLDFGTSNSTVGVAVNEVPKLCALEDGYLTLPSAIFFDYEEKEVKFGRRAIETYIQGANGRLMRSLKSVLGSPLMREATIIQGRPVNLSDVLALFLRHLKTKAEQAVQKPIDSVVVGRPVRFDDDNDIADRRASDELIEVAQRVGFRHVELQFEPIAAALSFEQQLNIGELIALVADIGGGTSDFAVVRLSSKHARYLDRSKDILAIAGVHLGGTDFDRRLSIATVMQEIGYQVQILPKGLLLPRYLFNDLATWHRINNAYSAANLSYLRSVLRNADQAQPIERLISVLRRRLGHGIADTVERAKIALSETESARIRVQTTPTLEMTVDQHQFEATIKEDLDRIVATAIKCCQLAAVPPAAIGAILLTGGSTKILKLQRQLLDAMPSAKIVAGDIFGSVGRGLTLDAQRRFS
ncbi:Hsp70 family protein [Mesorhizobium sp. B2-4-13]|uniref:Hsp70 family protein n=1 Tax=Mesorhizobium sp. B2-4-13 TaxID=2589936 RepID=UPI0011536E99|nr:Hsp70 family protein [Mesorhizobium sp. B2-4-13]TPK87040.1 Hsp70 family protein [Mesorhizobium sp. B2-4-13]